MRPPLALGITLGGDRADAMRATPSADRDRGVPLVASEGDGSAQGWPLDAADRDGVRQRDELRALVELSSAHPEADDHAGAVAGDVQPPAPATPRTPQGAGVA